ncbi:MAG: enoyl-CoA hydratase/isomerase family protein [Gemmatimonadetes bacterium]|nr:enoyl-CoA hydratase/isomerase family protein [Gemmatimonadota bacterium]
MTPLDSKTADNEPGSSDTTAAGFQYLHVERVRGAAKVVLDRPPLNVLNIDMLRELTAAMDLLAADADVAVVAITGAGRAFCAGVDVADHTEDRVHDMIESFHEALLRVRSAEMPTVAMVNGAALGGGMELALACDITVARAGAKLGQPEILLGVLAPFASAVLPGMVGRARALDLCLTGRTVLAEEAAHMGFVQQVWPKDEFPGAAEEYLRSISELSGPVLRLAKRAVDEGANASLADALPAVERIYLDELMSLEDAREGLTAFLEKRPPVWKGR